MNNKLIFLQDLGTMYPNENSKTKRRYGLYRCFCGKEFKAITQSIKSYHTQSCGCKEGNIKHKLYNHRLYRIWANIKDRCTNEKK